MDDLFYYKILGVQTNCSENEIRIAYRKLALKFHPDKNPDDKFFEDRFKEIQSAYECLSSPQLRQAYDLRNNNRNTYKEQPPPAPPPKAKPKEDHRTNNDSSQKTNTERTAGQVLADAVEDYYRKRKYFSREAIDHAELINVFEKVTKETFIVHLVKDGDVISNERIIVGLLGLYKFLTRDELSEYSGRLVKLAHGNNDLIVKIHECNRREVNDRKTEAAISIIKFSLIVAFALFILYLVNRDNKEPSTKNNIAKQDDINTLKQWTPPSDAIPSGKPSERLMRGHDRISAYAGKSLNTGDSPYDGYFGYGVYDPGYFNELTIKNGQGLDAIVCLTEFGYPNRTIRNEYIRVGDSFRMTSIPNGTYYLKTFFGKDWNRDTLLNGGMLKGFFDTSSGFTVSDEEKDLLQMKQDESHYSTYTITLYPVVGGKMKSRPISPEDFFKK